MQRLAAVGGRSHGLPEDLAKQLPGARLKDSTRERPLPLYAGSLSRQVGHRLIKNIPSGLPTGLVVGPTSGRCFKQASGANLADAQGQGAILNDDGPVLTIADVTRAEGHIGSKNALFKVSLTRASTSTVTVKYATANGTAQASSDYVATSGVLTFPAGQLVRTVSAAVRGDRVKEGHETFFVNLSGPSGATLRECGPARGNPRRAGDHPGPQLHDPQSELCPVGTRPLHD
jgi:hypothetical protein